MCRGCGAYTQPRNGKGDAYAYCKACHPGAIHAHWTGVLVLEAMREWRRRYGGLPSSSDWSRTHAQRRREEAVARLVVGDWPAPATVTKLYGTWAAARAAAGSDDGSGRPGAATVRFSNRIHVNDTPGMLEHGQAAGQRSTEVVVPIQAPS